MVTLKIVSQYLHNHFMQTINNKTVISSLQPHFTKKTLFTSTTKLKINNHLLKDLNSVFNNHSLICSKNRIHRYRFYDPCFFNYNQTQDISSIVNSYQNTLLNPFNSKDNCQNITSIAQNIQSIVVNKVKEAAKARFLFDETLHNEVYIGMKIFETANNIEVIEKQIQEIRLMLKEFAANSNPFELTFSDLKKLNSDVLDAVTTFFPEVTEVAQYLLKSPGKRFRPVLGLLVNKIITKNFTNINPDISMQTKMIEVAELIHTASMMHDDVLDDASIRRGSDSANKTFGNKKSILGGDFLLSRACRISATFGKPEVCERTSNIVESLAKGELIQSWISSNTLNIDFNTYLTKTYYKTAALMAETCACGSIIGGFSNSAKDFSFKLGGVIGMAFQLCDDLLDYSMSSKELGKPSLNDIKSGIITSPLYFSAFENSQNIIPIIKRKMNKEGDFEKVLNSVYSGSAIPRSKLLVLLYIKKALEMLQSLPSNQTKEGCIHSKGLAGLMLTLLNWTSKH